MRIGLTGASGTLGRRIRAELEARGHEVDAFAGDLTDSVAATAWASGHETVIHSAAMVPVGEVAADTARAIAVNVGGSVTIARAVAKAGGRMVQISTSHVYRPSDEALAEDASLAPASDYGLTKLHAEHWVKRILPDAAILRLFSFFDAQQAASYVVPALAARIEAAEFGAELDLHGAQSVRDIADAAWLAARVVDALEAKVSGPLNICTGSGVKIETLARKLSKAFGRSDIKFVPVEGEANRLVGDTARYESEVGTVADFDLDAALTRFMAERGSA